VIKFRQINFRGFYLHFFLNDEQSVRFHAALFSFRKYFLQSDSSEKMRKAVTKQQNCKFFSFFRYALRRLFNPLEPKEFFSEFFHKNSKAGAFRVQTNKSKGIFVYCNVFGSF
jgi:hypothetical protein